MNTDKPSGKGEWRHRGTERSPQGAKTTDPDRRPAPGLHKKPERAFSINGVMMLVFSPRILSLALGFTPIAGPRS